MSTECIQEDMEDEEDNNAKVHKFDDVAIGRQLYQNNVEWAGLNDIDLCQPEDVDQEEVKKRFELLKIVESHDFEYHEIFRAMHLAFALKDMDYKELHGRGYTPGIVLVPLISSEIMENLDITTGEPYLLDSDCDMTDTDCNYHGKPVPWEYGFLRLATKSECLDYVEKRRKDGEPIDRMIYLNI